MQINTKIVILAAGQASRFRATSPDDKTHKALAPLWDERGTLELLLQQLGKIGVPASQVSVTTGYMAEELSRIAEMVCPGVTILHNPDYASHSMLQTLAHTLAILPAEQGCWVLFADTLYTQQALQRLIDCLALPEARQWPRVAVVPLRNAGKREVAVALSPDRQNVIGFNPVAGASHQMAHAVYWPAGDGYRDLILKAPVQAGAAEAKQWHVLAGLLNGRQPGVDAPPHTGIRALELPAGAAVDIDTQADLDALRHQQRICSAHLAYFRSNLCKDQRSLITPDHQVGQYYLKHCMSDAAARHEAQVMALLHGYDAQLVPEVVSQQGCTLTMQLSSGIRLYDLFRMLRGQPRAEGIRHILLTRCSQRLDRIQGILQQHRSDISTTPYPFEDQVARLLVLLAELLGIDHGSPRLAEELQQLGDVWNSFCCIPFRDATPKNIIVADARVNPCVPASRRAARILDLVQQPDSYWQQVPIRDIDFTSTWHLTVPEDDRISLHAHASTFGSLDMSAEELTPGHFSPNRQRRDLALLVRYVRFGGRKLAYKLLNPRGFEVRFRYDEPCFYLERLPTLLSKDFHDNYPNLCELLLEVRDSAERYRGIQLSGNAQDAHLQALATPLRYWQESPLEPSQDSCA